MCNDRKVKEGALIEAVVAVNDRTAENLWRLRVRADLWPGDEPQPGQFVMLRVAEGFDPLLSRPFGIAGFARSGDGAEVEILYRPVGRGTGLMTGWKRGLPVSFLGPLGSGFPDPPPGSRSLMVAGGIGLPPLLALVRRMAAIGRGKEITLLYGDASYDRMIDLGGEAKDAGVELLTCTEDGSCGFQGLVTDRMAELGAADGYHLYVCGPNAMMRAVFDVGKGMCLTSHYSLESRMACGFGVCMGCAVAARDGDAEVYLRVCREGPVFSGDLLTDRSFPVAL